MKRVLFLMALSISINVFAQVEINGICYEFYTTPFTYIPSATVVAKTGGYSGHVVIPSSVNYHDVTYPVTSIGDEAFKLNTALTSIVLPNSLTSIGYKAFFGTSITHITIPNSVERIYDDAFSLSKLSSITWGNGLTEIGYGVFSDCQNLTSITIPNTITAIRRYAFSDCYNLTSVTIPNSVTIIEAYAFENCYALISVTIPNSVTDIGEYAFRRVPNIVYSGSLDSYSWRARSVNGYIEGYFVFSDDTKTSLLACSSLVEGDVSIPNSVTRIGSYAFISCKKLTSVTIPKSVRSCSSYVFYECDSLTSVIWNAKKCTMPFDDESAFRFCSNINSFTFGEDVDTIPPYLLYKQGKIQSLIIPDNVKVIESKAFQDCSGLSSLTIGCGVKEISSRVFYNCSVINLYISNLAQYCQIEFADNYSSPRAKHLFLNNVEIKDLVIPEDITTISAFAFYNVAGITSLYCEKTNIEPSAFARCENLKSVIIGSGVTDIGGNFADCSNLTSVTIGSNVTSLGSFNNCTNIKSFTCLRNTPPTVGYPSFQNVNCANIPLYVPAGRVAAYKAATTWKNFNPIIPIQVQADAMQIEEVAMIHLGTDSVKLKWFSVDGAATYTIEEHGVSDSLRMFTLDAQGQLQSILLDTIADVYMTNRGVSLTSNGWQYIIKSMESGAEYTYIVTARDENGVVLYSQVMTPREELQPEVHTWTLAGIPDIFGSNWEPEDTNNDMVLQEDGTYKWEKDDLALTVGSISFAVCYDHSQNISYPSGNYVLEIQETGTYTITITFNPETHDIIATATKISGDAPLPEVHTWTIVGGSPAFGSQWDIENTNNDMLLQEDGTYKWEKTNQELSAETIEFKICYDHGWTSVYPSDNYVLAIQEAGTYTITITFNPETHNIIATATKEIPQMNTCAEVNANTEQNVGMALGEVTVLYVRLPHIYVQDNTATTLIYSNQYANLQAGDHVQGIVGLAKSFRGLPELAPTTPFDDLIISSDGAPQIEDAVTIPSMNDINRVMMLRRVNMPDATFPSSKTTIYGTFMGAELAFVNYWKDSYTFNSTKTYDILGCVGNYNGELQIYVSEITETPTSSETPTGIKDINPTNITATKKMINGQLYILRGQKTYTLHGQEVR